MAEKKTSRTLTAVILAAGKGKRLKSSTPKVLHPVCGKPALWYVLRAARAARPTKIVVVIGHGGDDVREAVKSWRITPPPVFVEQPEQLGTGHAVLAAEKAVGKSDEVLIANGDFDPVRPEDVRSLVSLHRRRKATASLISTVLDEPGGYGRIVREDGRVTDVIEGIDASAEVRRIREVGTNWIVFRRDILFATLPILDRNNRQREYY
ncbi:MAG: bifunctional UDP-N-acetylglucosamine pyrophosphorylase / glucosamine-phosphate N-acetyltransferase, partial [Actinomycetota bacterium]|nr:bifunctional UDP-N-acetylglucosamine pyrophosphorylase / glucosamine-phosphate N-acetyltransferase [Actinomycetota bacterium]